MRVGHMLVLLAMARHLVCVSDVCLMCVYVCVCVCVCVCVLAGCVQECARKSANEVSIYAAHTDWGSVWSKRRVRFSPANTRGMMQLKYTHAHTHMRIHTQMYAFTPHAHPLAHLHMHTHVLGHHGADAGRNQPLLQTTPQNRVVCACTHDAAVSTIEFHPARCVRMRAHLHL